MATAREIRSLIEKTTTGTHRRRVPEEVKVQVRARHPGRGALLLADRVSEARRGRAARLSAGGHSQGRPEPGHGHPRARPQVLGTLRETGA